MTIRVSLDKQFPHLDEQIRRVISEGVSQKSNPIYRISYEDKTAKIYDISGLMSDEEQGIIEDLRANGFPARSLAER